MTDYVIRRATIEDAGRIAHHRVRMFSDMGQVPTAALEAELLQASTVALRAAFEEGSYLGWAAVDCNGTIVGGAGVHIKDQLPRITADALATGPVPLVVNVYTEPQWRGRGIARALMQTLMQWAREEGVDRLILHASDAGRPLYESLGFVPTNEMRWSAEKD